MGTRPVRNFLSHYARSIGGKTEYDDWMPRGKIRMPDYMPSTEDEDRRLAAESLSLVYYLESINYPLKGTFWARVYGKKYDTPKAKKEVQRMFIAEMKPDDHRGPASLGLQMPVCLNELKDVAEREFSADDLPPARINWFEVHVLCVDTVQAPVELAEADGYYRTGPEQGRAQTAVELVEKLTEMVDEHGRSKASARKMGRLKELRHFRVPKEALFKSVRKKAFSEVLRDI